MPLPPDPLEPRLAAACHVVKACFGHLDPLAAALLLPLFPTGSAEEERWVRADLATVIPVARRLFGSVPALPAAAAAILVSEMRPWAAAPSSPPPPLPPIDTGISAPSSPQSLGGEPLSPEELPGGFADVLAKRTEAVADLVESATNVLERAADLASGPIVGLGDGAPLAEPPEGADPTARKPRARRGGLRLGSSFPDKE